MQSKADKKFFSGFYDKNVDKVFRFIFLKVSSQEVSQDLTAEVFLRFWEQLDNPTKIENPRAFVYQVARNLVIDYYRKSKPITIQPEQARIPGLGPNLEQQAILNSDMDTIRSALCRLSEDYQNVLIWYYLEDFSVSEIGEMLSKSENAVRVTIHRALNALRQDIEKQE